MSASRAPARAARRRSSPARSRSSADGVTIDGVEITGDGAGPARHDRRRRRCRRRQFQPGQFGPRRHRRLRASFVGRVTGLDVGDNLIRVTAIGDVHRGRRHDRLGPRQSVPGRWRAGHRPWQRRQQRDHARHHRRTTRSTASMRGVAQPVPVRARHRRSRQLHHRQHDHRQRRRAPGPDPADQPSRTTSSAPTSTRRSTARRAALATASPARSASTARAATTTPGAATRATPSPAAPATTGCSAMAATTSDRRRRQRPARRRRRHRHGARSPAALTFIDTVRRLGDHLVPTATTSSTASRSSIDGSGQRNLLVGATGFASIQAALDEAQAGDHVRLAAGTYTGTVNYSDAGLTVIAQPGAMHQRHLHSTAGALGITIMRRDAAPTASPPAAATTCSIGGGGADAMTGGAGNDIYLRRQCRRRGRPRRPAAASTSSTASVSYTLTAGAEVEVLSTDRPRRHRRRSTSPATSWPTPSSAMPAPTSLNGGGGADTAGRLGGNDTYLRRQCRRPTSSSRRPAAASTASTPSVSYTLGAGVEVEIAVDRPAMAATDAIDLTGNELANSIVRQCRRQHARRRRRRGRSGSATAAPTRFAFTTALGGGNVDTIVDFARPTTRSLLDDAVFTGARRRARSTAGAFVDRHGGRRCRRPDHLQQRHRRALLRRRRQRRRRGGAVRDALHRAGADRERLHW